tara:strand:+ start:30 stop:491 length:462 start_codon:yes stop_codon:yes gene_type:complete
MDLIFITSASSSFVSLLTNSVINTAIGDTSTLLLSIFTNINHDTCIFKKTIEELDLYNKLSIIDNFINIIPHKYENNKSISPILQSLHDVIILIYNELSEINGIIVHHKTKFFYSYRTPNYKTNINQIILYKSILDTRFDMLLKILNTIQFLK